MRWCTLHRGEGGSGAPPLKVEPDPPPLPALQEFCSWYMPPEEVAAVLRCARSRLAPYLNAVTGECAATSLVQGRYAWRGTA